MTEAYDLAVRFPGSVSFFPDELAAIRDAQLVMAGVRVEELDRIPEFQADLLLRLHQLERQHEWRFQAKLHGAKMT